MQSAGRIGHLALSIYSYALILAASAMAIPLLTLGVAVRAPFVSHRTAMRYFRRAISLYGKIVTSMPYPFIRLRYEDHGDASDTGAPYIFVCNHRSASDAYLLCVFPYEIVQIVNVWPFKIPVIGQFAKAAGYLNIKRMDPDEFFSRCRELLGQGVSIAFFPEGTRSASRRMGSFNGAFARLALQCGAPIVPVCISGSEDIPRKGSLMLRPGTIRVRRLPAVQQEDYKGMQVFTLKNRIRDTIQHELDLMEAGS